MRLNTKIGLSLAAPMLVLFGLLGAAVQTIVVERFEALERQALGTHHERLLQALDTEFDELQRLAVDWAVWDDAYQFMLGNNPDYLVVNVTPSTFDNLQLDGLLIFDAQHRLHDDYTYDVAAQRFSHHSPLLVQRIASMLAERPGDRPGHGIIEHDGRVLQLGFSPIHDSNGAGTSLGTLLMMRSIDANRVEQLAERIQLQLHFFPLTGSLDGVAVTARDALRSAPLFVAAADQTAISAWSMLDDLSGAPALLMQVDMPRDITRQGQRAVGMLLASGFAAILLLGASMFVAIRQVALKRLSRIGRTLVAIGSGGATHERLPVGGSDEIDRLARSINAMLDGLDQAWAARRHSVERQRELNALLVRIATDDGLARGDEESLFRVLTGSLAQGVRVDRWSLWLRSPEQSAPTCWRSSDAPAELPAAVIGDELAAWDGRDGAVLRLGAAVLGPGRNALLLPFAVEQWRGAMVVEALDGLAAWPDDEISFLVSATALVERSLAAHLMQQREQSLRQQADYDALTGLANRAMFERHLRQALQRGQERNEHVCVLFIDLDRFKPVNDEHGHAVGDWLLCRVAERICATLRTNDLVARLGGDEFTVVVDTLRSVDVAGRIAAKLVKAVSTPFEYPSLTLQIGCSIGVACAADSGYAFEPLIHAADKAMYAAKQAGRNTWRCASHASTVAPLDATT